MKKKTFKGLFALLCFIYVLIYNVHKNRRLRPQKTQSRPNIFRSGNNSKIFANYKYYGRFQFVSRRPLIYGYSAIYDTRESPPVVRVLILAEVSFIAHLPRNSTCVFSYYINRTRITVVGRYDEVHHSLQGKDAEINLPTFLVCVVNGLKPTHVSMTIFKNSTIPNTLRINYPKPQSNMLTRCNSPVFGNISAATMVTALEVGRYFGTDRFVYYDYNCTSDVRNVLRKYEKEGLVELRNWTGPASIPLRATRAHWQLSAVKDCLYSNMETSKYILFADVDEIVIPRREESITSLADRFFERNSTASISFQNIYMFTFGTVSPAEFPYKEDAIKYKMEAFLHSISTSNVFEGIVAKVLVKPKFVEQMQVHYVVTCKGGYTCRTVTVPKDVAGKFHYRPTWVPFYAVPPERNETILLQHARILVPRIKTILDYLIKTDNITV